MAKLLAKYRVDCDLPGMSIAGAGRYLNGASIVLPGTILNLPASFEPRACMFPMNKVAEDAFAKKRKKIEAAWRESLARGEDPEGHPIEGVELPLPDKTIDAMVKREVAKVGPVKTKTAQLGRKAKRPVAPTFSVGDAEETDDEDTEDDGEPVKAPTYQNQKVSQRASDQ